MTQKKLRIRGVNSGGVITNPIITFTKENYGTNVDVVSQYLTLKRGNNQGLFNTNEGGSYSQTVLGGVRHLWMSEPMIYSPHVEGTVNIGKTYPTDLNNLVIFFIYNGIDVSGIGLGSFVNGNNGFEMTVDENGDSIVTINSNPWNDQLISLPSFDINDYEIVLKVHGENGWEVYNGENTINLTYTPPQLSNYFSSLNYWQENLWSTFDPSSIDVQQLVNTIGDGTIGSNWPTLQMVPWQIVHNGNPLQMLNKEMIMLDVLDGKFYKVKFTQWTQGGNGGGLSYTRQLLSSVVVPTTTTTTTMAQPEFNTSSSYFIDTIETVLNKDKRGASLMSYLALNTSNIGSYILSSGIMPQKLTIRVISIMGNVTQIGKDYSLTDKQTGDVLQTFYVGVLEEYSRISNYSDIKLQILYNGEEILESRSLFNGTIEGGTEPLDKVYTLSGFDSTSNGYIDSIIGGYAADNSLTWDGTYNFVVNGEMNLGKYFYFLDEGGYKQLLNTNLYLPLHIPLVGDEMGNYDYLFNVKGGKTNGIGNLFTITYIEDYVEPTLADDEFSGYLTDDNYLVEGSGVYVLGGGSTTTTTTNAPTTTTTTTEVPTTTTTTTKDQTTTTTTKSDINVVTFLNQDSNGPISGTLVEFYQISENKKDVKPGSYEVAASEKLAAEAIKKSKFVVSLYDSVITDASGYASFNLPEGEYGIKVYDGSDNSSNVVWMYFTGVKGDMTIERQLPYSTSINLELDGIEGSNNTPLSGTSVYYTDLHPMAQEIFGISSDRQLLGVTDENGILITNINVSNYLMISTDKITDVNGVIYNALYGGYHIQDIISNNGINERIETYPLKPSLNLNLYYGSRYEIYKVDNGMESLVSQGTCQHDTGGFYIGLNVGPNHLMLFDDTGLVVYDETYTYTWDEERNINLIGSPSGLTYVANGSSATDGVYTNVSGIVYSHESSSSVPSDVTFDITVEGGVVTSVVIKNTGNYISYNGQGILIQGFNIGGTDAVDDVLITLQVPTTVK